MRIRRLFIIGITIMGIAITSACGGSTGNNGGSDNGKTDNGNTEQGDKDKESTEQGITENGGTEQSGADKDADGGPVVVDIKAADTYQTIEGFGAGYTYYSNYVYFTKYKEEVYDKLFKDANLTVLRFKNGYKYDEEKEFDPKVEREFYAEAKERLEADGLEPKVLMSSWSPAAYLKDSENIYGEGTIAKDKKGNYKYDEYGKYWAELVDAYRKEGVAVDYISIQNEPDYVAGYESCTFDFDETAKGASYPKAYLAVYDAVNKLDNPPKMLGPETMSCNIGDITLMMDEILDTRPETVYGICHHLYVGGDENKPRSFNPNFTSLNLEYPDLSKWMTEYYRGDFMTTVQVIQDSLLYENLNCYIFWGGVWIGNEDQNKENMIGIDSATDEEQFEYYHGYHLNPKYYAMRHFSEYILPDYVRIGSKVNYDTGDSLDTDSLSCSAYISPDKKKAVLVAINDLDENKELKFNFEGIKPASSKVILSNYQKKEETENFYEDAGSLDENMGYEIPAHSIITVAIDM